MSVFREEYPVLLTSFVHIAHDRITGLIDAPCLGLPAVIIQRVESKITEVSTIENKTTVHRSEAKKRQ